MFKFNFSSSSDSQSHESSSSSSSKVVVKSKVCTPNKSTILASIAHETFRDFEIEGEHFQLLEPRLSDVTRSKDCALKSIVEEDCTDVHRPNGVCIYEGGLKLWECAVDLVTYIKRLGSKNCTKQVGHKDCTNQHSLFGPGRNVLELGCGLGLPGITALRLGSNVCFQDLNIGVLLSATSVHVAKNCPNSSFSNHTTTTMDPTSHMERSSIENTKDNFHSKTPLAYFISGDWKSEILDELLSKVSNNPNPNRNNSSGFDTILSAETLYTIESSTYLAKLIHTHLRIPNITSETSNPNPITSETSNPNPITSETSNPNPITSETPSSVALIATKRYYFGLGGGTETFIEQVKHLPKRSIPGNNIAFQLVVHIVAEFEDGQSNIRDILKLTWKPIS